MAVRKSFSVLVDADRWDLVMDQLAVLSHSQPKESALHLLSQCDTVTHLYRGLTAQHCNVKINNNITIKVVKLALISMLSMVTQTTFSQSYCVYANRTQAKKIITILNFARSSVITRSIKIHYEKSQNANFLTLIRSLV